MLYNAECDKLDPRPVSVLKREISEMEKYWIDDKTNYFEKGTDIEKHCNFLLI